MSDNLSTPTAALQDFWRARRRANLRQVLSRLSGDEQQLLSYDEVRRQLRAVESPGEELKQIPLDAIVGSVGRYNDFTRRFLPRLDSTEQRWVGVRRAMTGMRGVPPIEVYQLGEAYFVKDGNHRVSVARELGLTSIQAYVTPVSARVPFSPDTDPSELIIKAELTEFLERTQLDQLRPGSDLSVTVPGQYHALLEHIDVHRYYMGLDRQQEVPFAEAVAQWHDRVYLPVVESIRATGLLHGFEGRTETDLYLWLGEHRAHLAEETGWELSSEAVAAGVAGDSPLSPERRALVLDQAATQPATAPSLANDILVPLSGDEGGWQALEQALLVAAREGSKVFGLHILTDSEQSLRADAQALRERFLARCAEAGTEAQFAFAYGRVAECILARAVWSDLMVVSLRYPPPSPLQGLAARLGSGYLQLLRDSPRPLLAVPGPAAPLECALLAYDGSSRADAALFAATYVALKWGLPLTVLSVAERPADTDASLERARSYLERYGVEASYQAERGKVADAILARAEPPGTVVLMGSYRRSRWLESVLGGVVEQVLMSSPQPVLVV